MYFIPGTTGFDDSDQEVYKELKKSLPDLEYYDWTQYSSEQICEFMA